MSVQTMRAYTCEMLKKISRDESLTVKEKNHLITVHLNDFAKRYFKNSTAQSLRDINLKKVDWKSLITDEGFRARLKKVRGKKYLNIPIYRHGRYFRPLVGADGKFHFNTYEEAEDALIDHVLESRFSGYVKEILAGKKPVYSGDETLMEYIFRERVSPEALVSAGEFEIDFYELEESKEPIRQMLDDLVSDIQKSFNLPNGWQIFIVACILNPDLIGGDLKIFRDISQSVEVEKVNKKSLNLRIDKGVRSEDLALMLEVFQVFLDYDIPTESLTSTSEQNIIARRLLSDKNKTHNMLAQEVYKDEYMAEDKENKTYALHTTTNNRITKKIHRAKNRNLDYSHKILSGRKIDEILARYR